MCGRLCCTLSAHDVIENCQPNGVNVIKRFSDDYKPIYNGPPTSRVPVLAWKSNFRNDDICDANSETDICLAAMRWGLMPSFKSDKLNMSLHTHNARYENILKSPLYKPCLLSGKRCVILVSGYYEWKTTTGANLKEPYFLYQTPREFKDAEAPFDLNAKHMIKLAGLFNVTKNENESLYSCTAITIESNKSLSWLHHRMPIFLNSESDVVSWLNSRDVDYNQAFKNLNDLVNDSHESKESSQTIALQHHVVDKAVNKSTYNERDCMNPKSLKRKRNTFMDTWLKNKK